MDPNAQGSPAVALPTLIQFTCCAVSAVERLEQKVLESVGELPKRLVSSANWSSLACNVVRPIAAASSSKYQGQPSFRGVVTLVNEYQAPGHDCTKL